MAGWLSGSQMTQLSVVLTDPNTTVAAVLDDPGFTAALRQPSPDLCAFFARTESIDQVLDLAFIEKRDTLADVKRMRQAVFAFSTTASRFQEKVFENERLKERLNSFPSSEFASNPRACGHFQRILEAFAKFTGGQILTELPDVRPFLIQNMNCLAIRDLFVNLAKQFPEALGVGKELFIELAGGMRSERAYFILTAINCLLSLREYDIEYLTNPDFVRLVLSAAVEGACSPAAACLAFELVRVIQERDDEEVAAVISEFEDKFSVEGKEIDAPFMRALTVFHKKALELIDRVFEPVSHTFLNIAILSAFSELSDTEKNKFAEEHHLVERIIEAFKHESKADGHVTLLASELNKISQDARTGALAEDSWDEFFNHEVAPRLKVPEAVSSALDYSDNPFSSESSQGKDSESESESESDDDQEYSEDESSSDEFQVTPRGNDSDNEDDAIRPPANPMLPSESSSGSLSDDL